MMLVSISSVMSICNTPTAVWLWNGKQGLTNLGFVERPDILKNGYYWLQEVLRRKILR